MKVVWADGGELGGNENERVFQGQYQDVLRSVGAWLDARGYTLTLISESGNSLVIEVETGAAGDDPEREVLRLDLDSLNRLAHAARNDRNRFATVS
jgi:hypothetical protein